MLFDILLVEDNDFDARRIVRALTRIGAPHRLERAMDGQDALNLLRSGREGDGQRARPAGPSATGTGTGSGSGLTSVDGAAGIVPALAGGGPGDRRVQRPYVVFLDLNMPVMGGLPFLDELRKDRDLANTPVIVMTTSEFYRDVECAHAHNVCGYMVKPVNGDDMIDLTRRVIAFLESCVLPT